MNFHGSRTISPSQYQSQCSLQIQSNTIYYKDYIKKQTLNKLLSARNLSQDYMRKPLPDKHIIEELLRKSAQTADQLPYMTEPLSQKIGAA